MGPAGRRWRVAVLGLLLAALLALVLRTQFFPHRPTMVANPCAAIAANQVPPEDDWIAACAYQADNARLIAAGIKPQLVLFGDSIFQDWGEAQPELFGNAWVNRGVRGQGSVRLLARFRGDVIALQPRTVIIVGGINDLIAADSVFGPDQYVANMETMIDLAEAHGINVIVATLPPVDHFTIRPGYAPQAMLSELNRRLRALAQRRGLAVADFHAALVAADGLSQRKGFSADGIHPTPAAYRQLEPVVRQALAQTEARKGGAGS